jgi:hypothetical protein
VASWDEVRVRSIRVERQPSGASIGPKCVSRYIPVLAIESAINAAIAETLAAPDRVIEEMRRASEKAGDHHNAAQVRERLKAIEAAQGRLARLYTSGMLPEDVLRRESEELGRQRGQIESALRELEGRRTVIVHLSAVEHRLPEIVRAVRDWIRGAAGDDLSLLLEATQAQIKANADHAEIVGVIPGTKRTRTILRPSSYH